MNKEPIFRHPEYQKINREDFTTGKYDSALTRFQSLYETLKSELSASDKAILMNRIANSASDAVLRQNIADPALIKTFWEYLEKYLNAAPRALKEDKSFRGSTDEPKKRLNEALELLIRYEPESLKEKAVCWTARFADIDSPGWGFDLSLDVLMQKINDERIRFTRKGHIANTEALSEAYIEVSERAGELAPYRYARATVMNILSDLVWFEGGKDSEKESLNWLNRCLEINPDDLFAKTRKKYIEERQTVQEQIRRFKHDTGNTKAGIEAMLTLCLRLPQAKEEPLRTYLKTVQTEVKHLYGVHRFIHNEQCRIEETDPQEIIRDLIAPHDRRNANFIMTVSGGLKKWKTDPDYLRLAVYNLIKNSTEAFQRRHIPLAERDIRISVLPDSHALIIEDNAGGIEPALKDHIFSPYVSSKGIKKETGLGLSNARRAVEIMGGTLEFPENQPENGAKFEIRLPE